MKNMWLLVLGTIFLKLCLSSAVSNSSSSILPKKLSVTAEAKRFTELELKSICESAPLETPEFEPNSRSSFKKGLFRGLYLENPSKYGITINDNIFVPKFSKMATLWENEGDRTLMGQILLTIFKFMDVICPPNPLHFAVTKDYTGLLVLYLILNCGEIVSQECVLHTCLSDNPKSIDLLKFFIKPLNEANQKLRVLAGTITFSFLAQLFSLPEISEALKSSNATVHEKLELLINELTFEGESLDTKIMEKMKIINLYVFRDCPKRLQDMYKKRVFEVFNKRWFRNTMDSVRVKMSHALDDSGSKLEEIRQSNLDLKDSSENISNFAETSLFVESSSNQAGSSSSRRSRRNKLVFEDEE